VIGQERLFKDTIANKNHHIYPQIVDRTLSVRISSVIFAAASGGDAMPRNLKDTEQRSICSAKGRSSTWTRLHVRTENNRKLVVRRIPSIVIEKDSLLQHLLKHRFEGAS
jgi:hypothetical protein